MNQIQTTTKSKSPLCKPQNGRSIRQKTRNKSAVEFHESCSAPFPHLSSVDMVTRLLQIGVVIGLMLCAANAWAGPASIQGIVNDTKGHPIKGADVRIESRDGKQLLDTAKTDARGRYISQGLQPGIYRVSLVVKGAVKASITNTKAKSNQATQLNFDLKPVTASQVTTRQKSGKHLVWVPASTGSHMGGRWVEVDEGGAAAAGASNVQRANAEDLQRQGQSMGVPATGH
jgi:5-hydroxyisourate hydrolase-like protein (transthyretin family)